MAELPLRIAQCKQTYSYLANKQRDRHAKEQMRLFQKFLNDYGKMSLRSLRRQEQLHASKQYKSMMEENQLRAAQRLHKRKTSYKYR